MIKTEVYIPTTCKEFSQRKIEEYNKFEKVINWGRKDPIRFSEEFFGIKLIDYQKWCFMQTWDKPFALWLCSRGTGKTTLAAVYLQTKMLLIPDYHVFVSANSLPFTVKQSFANIGIFQYCT